MAEAGLDGWTRPADITPLAFARRFDRLDLGGILLRDVDYDMDMAEASFALVADMARRLRTPVIASGAVKSLDDLSTLRYLGSIAAVEIVRAATMAQAPGKRPAPAPRGQDGGAGKGKRSPERGVHQG